MNLYKYYRYSPNIFELLKGSETTIPQHLENSNDEVFNTPYVA